MSPVRSKGNIWHDAVAHNDGGRCAVDEHDPRCDGIGVHAHHIVYRAHLNDDAMWLKENGIFVSLICHQYTHKRHNLNINQERLDRAVDAVNAVKPWYTRVPYFRKKPWVA